MPPTKTIDMAAMQWTAACGLVQCGIPTRRAMTLMSLSTENVQAIRRFASDSIYGESHRISANLLDMLEKAEQKAIQVTATKQQAAERALLAAAVAGNERAAQYLRETAGRSVPNTLKAQLAQVEALLAIADAKSYPALYNVQKDLQERVALEKLERTRKKQIRDDPDKMLEELALESIEQVGDILRKGSPEQKLKAANTILDRKYPKMTSANISGSIKTNTNLQEIVALAETIKGMTPDQLAALDQDD